MAEILRTRELIPGLDLLHIATVYLDDLRGERGHRRGEPPRLQIAERVAALQRTRVAFLLFAVGIVAAHFAGEKENRVIIGVAGAEQHLIARDFLDLRLARELFEVLRPQFVQRIEFGEIAGFDTHARSPCLDKV